MAKKFVITRNGSKRLMIIYGEHRAEHIEDAPNSLERCLGLLGLNQEPSALLASLKDGIERFYQLETRSLAKFGKPKTFRIWRVSAKTLQIDFKGGYTELSAKARSDATFKRCLEELGANQLLLSELKRELAEFLRDEKKGKVT